MWKLFPVFLALFVVPGTHAQSERIEQGRILSLENAWNQAIQQKDGTALKLLLAPELVYVDYDGSLMDKAAYLASITAPALHPARIVNEAMTVHLYGAAAVVSGLCREFGINNGKRYAILVRFTDTWVRRGESWMCVASHSTLINQ